MCKTIDGLAGMVEQHFKLDPFSRAMFVFCNKEDLLDPDSRYNKITRRLFYEI